MSFKEIKMEENELFDVATLKMDYDNVRIFMLPLF